MLNALQKWQYFLILLILLDVCLCCPKITKKRDRKKLRKFIVVKFKLEFLSKSCTIRMPNFLIKERESSCKAGMAILLRYSVFYYILGGETAI